MTAAFPNKRMISTRSIHVPRFSHDTMQVRKVRYTRERRSSRRVEHGRPHAGPRHTFLVATSPSHRSSSLGNPPRARPTVTLRPATHPTCAAAHPPSVRPASPLRTARPARAASRRARRRCTCLPAHEQASTPPRPKPRAAAPPRRPRRPSCARRPRARVGG
jgi:hypothetical protein